IFLSVGEKLQIDLPLTELEKRIYTPGRIDDNIIDLCSLAGRDSPRPTLTTDFNEQQEPQNECMTIHVFARSYSKTANYQPFMLKETDIDWASIQPVWTAERGQAYINRQNASMNKMTHIPLKNGKSPFGNDNLLINMPQADFSAAYTTAKLENQNTLDLRPQTAPQQKNKSKLRGIKR
ncbi:MAG: hypothetical protein OXT65_06695, partial [Alphaproteobacteria bacterium]|nr:hypothetical protein [Alphaproteobacteria bacterium]